MYRACASIIFNYLIYTLLKVRYISSTAFQGDNMWKYFTSEHNKEFFLSLNLITADMSDEKKLNVLYAIANNSQKYYTIKYINKKDGTKRKLLIPNSFLKRIQQNILHNILYSLTPSKYVKSYQQNLTLKDNASPHQNQKIVLKLDIKNFFPSISFEDIYKILPNEILPPSIKVLITHLCTYENYLPQGAPTSPMLSNLVLKNFDDYIGSYCEKQSINYTRYCDDLTFSGDFNPYYLINKVRAFLEEIGFNLNDKKTKIITRKNRQIITGLVVNKKINVPKQYRKKIRQEMYYINKYGLKSHLAYLNIKDKNQYIANLRGRINYCLQIDDNNKEMQKYLNDLSQLILKK